MQNDSVGLLYGLLHIGLAPKILLEIDDAGRNPAAADVGTWKRDALKRKRRFARRKIETDL